MVKMNEVRELVLKSRDLMQEVYNKHLDLNRIEKLIKDRAQAGYSDVGVQYDWMLKDLPIRFKNELTREGNALISTSVKKALEPEGFKVESYEDHIIIRW